MTLLPPTPEQQKRIDTEVPPDPEATKRDLQVIRQWLSRQPHLPKHIDDVMLGRFLFGCKNNVERCKLILERYYDARIALTEFFAARDPLAEDIQRSCEAIEYFVLPSLTNEGHRVSIIRLRMKDIENFNTQAMTRRMLMTLDARLMEERCLSNVIVVDVEGFTMMHFAKFSPTQSIIRKAMLALQDSMPFRLYRIYFLHAPAVVSNIVSLFYPFLKKRLIEKFSIHTGGGEVLHAFMDKDILPNEWGGKAGTFSELNDAWKKKIEKNRDWFLREEKLCRANENARIPRIKSDSILKELDGMQGSFRKLNID